MLQCIVYMLNCVLTTQSQVFFCHQIFDLLYPLHSHSFSFLVTTTLSSVPISFVSLNCFPQHDTFKIHPYCHRWQYFILLWLSGIPLYICTTPSLSNQPLKDTGCLHVLTLTNNAAMNMREHISLQRNVFIFQEQIPRRRIGSFIIRQLYS